MYFRFDHDEEDYGKSVTGMAVKIKYTNGYEMLVRGSYKGFLIAIVKLYIHPLTYLCKEKLRTPGIILLDKSPSNF